MDNPNSLTLPQPKPESASTKPAPSVEQSPPSNQGSSKQSSPQEQNLSSTQGYPSEQLPPSNQAPVDKQSTPVVESSLSPPTQIHSPVLILNNSNFKEIIASKDPTLVLFYTTWCSSCKKFKPKYQDVAKELAPKVLLRFAVYDCTNNEEDILDEYEIVLFPTLKLFREGKYERDYDGKRNPEELKGFATKWAKAADEV